MQRPLHIGAFVKSNKRRSDSLPGRRIRRAREPKVLHKFLRNSYNKAPRSGPPFATMAAKKKKKDHNFPENSINAIAYASRLRNLADFLRSLEGRKRTLGKYFYRCYLRDICVK